SAAQSIWSRGRPMIHPRLKSEAKAAIRRFRVAAHWENLTPRPEGASERARSSVFSLGARGTGTTGALMTWSRHKQSGPIKTETTWRLLQRKTNVAIRTTALATASTPDLTTT